MGHQRGVLRLLDDDASLLGFWCPGCRDLHIINVDERERPSWGFDGNYGAPTFTPSIRVNPGRANPAKNVCHSFVRAGRIEFLGDCTHELGGKTVNLEPPPGGAL